MSAVLDMAKAHLQNVSMKIEELEQQKQVIQSEIDKLRTYLEKGIESINSFSTNVDSQQV